jgi:hypothetical protein
MLILNSLKKLKNIPYSKVINKKVTEICTSFTLHNVITYNMRLKNSEYVKDGKHSVSKT